MVKLKKKVERSQRVTGCNTYIQEQIFPIPYICFISLIYPLKYAKSEVPISFIVIILSKMIVSQFSQLTVMSDFLWQHGLQHTRLLCLSPDPRACSDSCPSSRWCHPTILSSVVPFCSCPQYFPESGSFLMSQLFASGGQSIAVSASASVLPMNIQDWFALGWTGWISLQSKGLSKVFCNTTVRKHQFFSP